MRAALAVALLSILIIACGHPPVNEFEPTIDASSSLLIVGIDTDLPDDATISMSLARYFRPSHDNVERPMTMNAYFAITVGQLRNGVQFDLKSEGQQFYKDVRRRLPHNPDWGKTYVTRVHHVAMLYNPDAGPLEGDAVISGQSLVRSTKQFNWGVEVEVQP